MQSAWYLDRTVHYVSRVGMEYITEKIVNDAENRQVLFERLLFDLKDAPDPWKEFERAGVDIRQFIPIKSQELSGV